MTRQVLPFLLAGGIMAMPTPAGAADEVVAPVVPASAAVSAPVAMETDTGFYATVSLGGNWPNSRDSSSAAGSFTETSIAGLSTELGVGYNFKPVRIELTYALDSSDLKGYDSASGASVDYSSGGRTNKNSGFASIYWDLLPKQRFTPYLGAGIGLSYLSIKSFSESGLRYDGFGRSLFGYQAKAGLSYTMDPKSKLFAEAIFRGTSDYRTNDGINDWAIDSFSSWGAQLGVRIGL